MREGGTREERDSDTDTVQSWVDVVAAGHILMWAHCKQAGDR